MSIRIASLCPLAAALFLAARPVVAQLPSISTQARSSVGSDGRNAATAFFYDSRKGNDFSGRKTVAEIGFTDVHGGVASCRGGQLVLTPDGTHGGTDAFSRDYTAFHIG